MELLSFVRSLTLTEFEAFAVAVGTTVGHLRNVAYRQRKASAALAAQVEIHTSGAVTRKMLRPMDWWLIWGDEGGNRTVDELEHMRAVRPVQPDELGGVSSLRVPDLATDA
jgi:DNA-binding transcriptional regulator YdaS (Cro superfamily)